jgi:hypothetical protein
MLDLVGQFIIVREIVGGLFEFLKIKNSRQNFWVRLSPPSCLSFFWTSHQTSSLSTPDSSIILLKNYRESAIAYTVTLECWIYGFCRTIGAFIPSLQPQHCLQPEQPTPPSTDMSTVRGARPLIEKGCLLLRSRDFTKISWRLAAWRQALAQ